MIQCETCFKSEGHYHIIVEQEKVTAVWYISADGYWDRELEPDKYAVEYRDDLKTADSVRRSNGRSVQHISASDSPQPGTSEIADWLEPMVYKGPKEDEEEEYLS
jgi:hypothetical protein